MNREQDKTSICSYCDLAVERVQLKGGECAKCPRCGSLLYQQTHATPTTILALCTTAIILIFPANLYPLLEMTMLGTSETTTLMQGAKMMLNEGGSFVAVLVVFCAVVAPFLMLSALWLSSAIISFAPNFRLLNRGLKPLLKLTDFMTHWSMLEVYLVSFLVAVFKLVDISEIEIGFGLVCFVLLMLINSLILINYDAKYYWSKVNYEPDSQ